MSPLANSPKPPLRLGSSQRRLLEMLGSPKQQYAFDRALFFDPVRSPAYGMKMISGLSIDIEVDDNQDPLSVRVSFTKERGFEITCRQPGVKFRVSDFGVTIEPDVPDPKYGFMSYGERVDAETFDGILDLHWNDLPDDRNLQNLCFSVGPYVEREDWLSCPVTLKRFRQK